MPETSKSSSLLRSFGLKMAKVILMSSIIGSGMFKKIAPMSELLYLPSLFILPWIFAGISYIIGVLSIGELAVMFPDSGFAYSWLKKNLWRNERFPLWMVLFTVIQTAAISTIAFVSAGALDTFVSLPQLPENIQSINFLCLEPFSKI